MTESGAPHRIVRFAVFEFDLKTGELRKHGLRLKLNGQPIDVLAMLIEHSGEVVTREELQKRLWSADTYVDFEHSLNAAMKRLRAALGDSADAPRFVETLARRGYRFIAPLSQPVDYVAQPTAHNQKPAGRRRFVPWALVAAFVLLAMIGLNVAGLRDAVCGRAVSRPIRSLAVLPLVFPGGHQRSSGDLPNFVHALPRQQQAAP